MVDIFQRDNRNWSYWLRIFTSVICSCFCFSHGITNGYAKTSDVPETLKEQLFQLVQEHLPWSGATFELSDHRLIGDLPSPPWRLEIRQGERFRGQMRVKVTGDKSSEQPAIWLSANIAVQIPVVVTSETISSGDRVEQNVHLEMKPQAVLPHDAVFHFNDLSGHVARRTLNSGEIVRESVLIKPVVVERNQVVTIIVRRGKVTVTDRGIALQSARAGEPVRVRSVSSDKVLTTIARRDGRVEVP